MGGSYVYEWASQNPITWEDGLKIGKKGGNDQLDDGY